MPIDAQIKTSDNNGGFENLTLGTATTTDIQKEGTKNSTHENPTNIEATVLDEASKCDTTKVGVAAALTTSSPVEVTPTIHKLSKDTPSLENIMTWNGKLKWNLSEIQCIDVGGFKVVGVISESGANGLVVSCTDAANKHMQ